jgi:hypothetical protein
MKGKKGMKKSQLITVLVITTLLVTIFSSSTVSALNPPPSMDTTANSHKLQYVSMKGSTTLAITTSTSQEIIYASFYSQTENLGLSISSTPALTWNYRGGGNAIGEIAVWWAVSAIAQPVTITFTSSHTSTFKDYVISAFCVKDANTVSPFDPNLSNAIFNDANSNSPSASITTTNPNDLVVGVLGFLNNKVITVGGGYTLLDSVSNAGSSGAVEYKTAVTAGLSTPNFGLSNGVRWVEIADAFAGNSLTVLPENSVGTIMVFAVCLVAMFVFVSKKKVS